MTLALAAVVKKRRRVVSTGVFVGGVLSTLSAWVIWVTQSFLARVRAGAEVHSFPSACFYGNLNYGEVNSGYH
jgi:hypothetical protein